VIVSRTFFIFLHQCVGQACKVHETTTLSAVTLPNIHRFKKMFSLADSAINLSYLVIKNPTTLIACFAGSDVSQDSVATYARRGKSFNIQLTANLLRNLPVKKIFN